MRALLLAMALAACVAAEAPAQPEPADAPAPPIQAAPPPPPSTLSLACAGAFTQGGLALCRTLPGAAILVDGVASGEADANGWAVIGFNREHGAESVVAARAQGATTSQTYAIAPREFDIQRVDGLPQQTVTPTDPEVIARIQREAALKRDGFASLAPIEGFLDGFVVPVEDRPSRRTASRCRTFPP